DYYCGTWDSSLSGLLF
nr:immunoglobulin light chain junction region [Macaca mulatta]MOX79295.1 immunoglobulin light chain junction region [Macaca mulatta]MOX81918.1 immunoglobulin light chain junction region [Macaca mulatta]MOX82068.1 immunoglobulin light chain junction region [Macaca mulatta]MOX82176.1 immunoglobulin light chain junction region [Macaca mulatta]